MDYAYCSKLPLKPQSIQLRTLKDMSVYLCVPKYLTTSTSDGFYMAKVEYICKWQLLNNPYKTYIWLGLTGRFRLYIAGLLFTGKCNITWINQAKLGVIHSSRYTLTYIDKYLNKIYIPYKLWSVEVPTIRPQLYPSEQLLKNCLYYSIIGCRDPDKLPSNTQTNTDKK